MAYGVFLLMMPNNWIERKFSEVLGKSASRFLIIHQWKSQQIMD